MNFRFIWLKGIVSVLSFVFFQTALIILVYRQFVFFVNPLNGLDIFGNFGIIINLLFAILVYVIWSLFQKGGKK